MLTFITYTMMVLYPFVGLILIAIILLQRGRGGGLAGAFGGMGGQSAFGTKAGDVFTKITIVLATIWIIMGGACVLLTSHSRTMANQFKGAPAVNVNAAPDADGESEDGDKTPGDDDVVPGPAPATTPDAKPGTDPVPPKTDPEKAAAEKPEAEKVDPEKTDPEKTDPEKPAAEKPDSEKSPPEKSDDAANEAAKSDSKDAPAEKPAEPAKGLDDSASPLKATDETKPE
jgi:preprotein translocase subunit SecG